jgi:hypothetical protein
MSEQTMNTTNERAIGQKQSCNYRAFELMIRQTCDRPRPWSKLSHVLNQPRATTMVKAIARSKSSTFETINTRTCDRPRPWSKLSRVQNNNTRTCDGPRPWSKLSHVRNNNTRTCDRPRPWSKLSHVRNNQHSNVRKATTMVKAIARSKQ